MTVNARWRVPSHDDVELEILVNAGENGRSMLHVDIPILTEFKALAATRSDACVSLYVPTSPLGEHARATRIAFEDLANEVLSQLKTAGLDKRRIAPIVDLRGHDIEQHAAWRGAA